MTAIAYRDGVMAADTLDMATDTVVSVQVKKIVRRADGALMGACGEASHCQRIMAAFIAGEEIEPSKDSNSPYAAIVAYRDRTVWRFTEVGQYELPEAPFHTDGSAHQILTGAMAMGASAEEAVAIAIKWHTRCGGEVQVERL